MWTWRFRFRNLKEVVNEIEDKDSTSRGKTEDRGLGHEVWLPLDEGKGRFQ